MFSKFLSKFRLEYFGWLFTRIGEIISYTPAAPYIVLIVGLTISVVAFLGCCGACMQNTCMLMSVLEFILYYSIKISISISISYLMFFCFVQFSVVMLVLLVVQLGFGLYGLINYDVMIEKGLYATLDAVNDQPNLQKAWIRIQKDVSSNRYCAM